MQYKIRTYVPLACYGPFEIDYINFFEKKTYSKFMYINSSRGPGPGLMPALTTTQDVVSWYVWLGAEQPSTRGQGSVCFTYKNAVYYNDCKRFIATYFHA